MGNKKLDMYFEQKLKDRLADCLTVAVAKGGVTAYEFYGTNHFKDEYDSFSGATRYNIGSVTKPVTASLLVKLIEKGLVSCNDKVQQYIPEFKHENVTIFHLLTHSAGFDNSDFLFGWPKRFEEEREYFKKIYAVENLPGIPGEVSGYFTAGYSIIMDIIERVSGMRIEDFAQKILFEPLDMKHTTYDIRKLARDSVIMPYDKREDRFDDFYTTPPTGDSGLYSTAFDLVKFGSLFLDYVYGRRTLVYSTAAFEFMISEFTGDRFNKTPVFWIKGKSDTYGCFAELSSPYTFGHTGFSGCMLSVDLDNDLAVGIVTNSIYLHEDWTNYRKIINIIMSELA
ncbi:MAG TPA: serine hydrolase domain-containing protein [Clostridia bacterium]|nr:serine hydrolase domain-containing protein [Clostridia bacterium]